MVMQLKQSLLSLHAITSSSADDGDSTAAGSPLDAVTNAVAQTKVLLEQLHQEEAALQQRLTEIDALQKYEQVWTSLDSCQASCPAVGASPPGTLCVVYGCSTAQKFCI